MEEEEEGDEIVAYNYVRLLRSDAREAAPFPFSPLLDWASPVQGVIFAELLSILDGDSDGEEDQQVPTLAAVGGSLLPPVAEDCCFCLDSMGGSSSSPRNAAAKAAVYDRLGERAAGLVAAFLGEARLALPSCGHSFHASCLGSWLQSGSFGGGVGARCPLCRAPFGGTGALRPL